MTERLNNDFQFIEVGRKDPKKKLLRQRKKEFVEIYDLFNNTYAGAPSLSLATPADFGKISSVGGNRSMQLGFRYTW